MKVAEPSLVPLTVTITDASGASRTLSVDEFRRERRVQQCRKCDQWVSKSAHRCRRVFTPWSIRAGVSPRISPTNPAQRFRPLDGDD